jgi:hypothetical protein
MTQHTVQHTRPAPRRRPGVRDKSSWTVPLALVVLSLIPVISGSLRLLEVAGGPQLLPTNPRIDASPVPVVVHVLGATLYAIPQTIDAQVDGRYDHGRARVPAVDPGQSDQ